MRSHAKASTAGSTQRQAKGLGRIFRGALATRGASLTTKGSGAPKVRRLVLPVAVLALAMALVVSPASALKFHAVKEIFGSAAQPTVSAWALGIDQSSGDVLVMDATGEDFTIKRFNPDGTPDNFSALGTNVIDGEGGADTTPQDGLSFTGSSESQIAIDESGTATDGNIYVTQGFPNLINVFAETGAYLGQLTAAGATDFSEACGVAVDSTGAVYVGDYTSGIHKFVPAANPAVNADHTATFTTTSEPCAMAAGAGPTAGFLFPTQYSGEISKIDSSTGELKYTVSSGFHVTVAVNPASGHVYGLAESTIEEFDASGGASASAVSNTSINGARQGLAVRGSSGDIFYSVASSTSDKIQVLSGALATSPDVTTTAATGITDTAATLNGTVNPDGEATSECVFEWGLTTAYGNTASCVPNPAGIGSGSSPVAVSVAIGGLQTATVYHYRLKAANPNGPIFGSDETLQSAGPRLIDSWAEDVLLTEATLRAEIDPEGVATTYRFEYGTSEAYGSETEELAVGSDSSAHKVTRFLEGLTPGTEYHYRVVATSAAGENVGPDRTIRTFRPATTETDCPNQVRRFGASASLPDCRAYEMVSPLDKNNGDVRTQRDVLDGGPGSRTQSTPSGEKLAYSSSRAFADALSIPWNSQYIARRVAGEEWKTHSINPPAGTPIVAGINAANAQYVGFSDDLCQGWLRNFFEPPLSDAALPGYLNLYRRNDRLCGPEGFEARAPIVSPLGEPESFSANFQGASADGSHAIFAANRKLAPEGQEATIQLYESLDSEALPRLVCILPNGESHKGSCTGGSGLASGVRPLSVTGAISEDGERVFWTDKMGRVEGKLYVRVGGVETVPVSQAGEELAGTTNSWFWGAANDGSRAVFTTGGTSDAHLFAFDVESEATEPIAEGVYGVAGMSENARRIYFLSSKALPGSGQNSAGAEALAGQPNLYLYDADDGGGTATFIATLANNDAVAVAGPYFGTSPIARESARISRVTPDGLHLAFGSLASLTGYDNKSLTDGSVNRMAYVYDAISGELACASCNPSGARGRRELAPEAPQNFRTIPFLEYETSLQPSRVLSDDGSRLFFESANALTPRDSNGKVDVYQWEALDAGGCDAADSSFAPSAGGCIELISSGKAAADAEFVEASATGDDVFINTLSSLVPGDYGLRDIYDARVDGGFPLPPEAPECVGDACQGIPAAPNDPTPASASFRGVGDPQPRKAKRRCRARSRKQAKNSKAKQKKAKRCRRNNRRAGR